MINDFPSLETTDACDIVRACKGEHLAHTDGAHLPSKVFKHRKRWRHMVHSGKQEQAL